MCVFAHRVTKAQSFMSGKSPGFDTRHGAIIIVFNYTQCLCQGDCVAIISSPDEVVPSPFVSAGVNTHAHLRFQNYERAVQRCLPRALASFPGEMGEPGISHASTFLPAAEK